MSKAEFKLPRKFTFDEYYELLKKLVSHPEGQKQFAIYDAECKAGRGDILDSENGGVAAMALFNLRVVGYQILFELGWPTYMEARKFENFNKTTDSKYGRMLQSFPDTALTIMRGGGAAFAPDLTVDIADLASVRRFLEVKMSIPSIAPYQIYDLEAGN